MTDQEPPMHHHRSIQPHAVLAAVLLFSGAGLPGCSSAPPVTRTGFLSDYSSLRPAGENRMRFASLQLNEYSTFIIDPVQIRSSAQGTLSAEDRAEAARHFRESLTNGLRERGYSVTTTPGAQTARIRVALTNIQQSAWWQKIHPASSLAGAGRGGASMEGEVIDSVTGDQLAAVVQSGVGSQFTLGNYSTIADLKNVIDQWVKTACDRLDELRRSGRP